MDCDNEEIEATKNKNEKSADEMFEKLDFIKVEDNKDFIEYRKLRDGEIFEIDFWKDDKTFSKNYYREIGYISMQELQAINKKVKELGWE